MRWMKLKKNKRKRVTGIIVKRENSKQEQKVCVSGLVAALVAGAPLEAPWKSQKVPCMSDAEVSTKSIDASPGKNAPLEDTLKVFLSLMYQFWNLSVPLRIICIRI